MQVPIWLWHPSKSLDGPVHAKNYRCCCSCFSSPAGFKLMNYVFLVLFIFSFVLYSLIAASGDLHGEVRAEQWYSLISWTIATFVAFFAIYTLKPFYMQLYLIFATFTLTIGITASAVGLVMFSMAYVDLRSHDSYLHVGDLREANLLAIIGLLILLILLIGQMQLTHSYYKYIRDRQLEIEVEAARPLSVMVPTTMTKELKVQYILPPPYEDC
ncbi:unnamed protein product, partial [Mesorhabditis spiculigera]